MALDAFVRDLLDLRRIERLLDDGICERARRAPLIDRDLRSLRLEIAQDLCELIDLFLRQIELVSEKSERPSDTEVSAPTLAAIPIGEGRRVVVPTSVP